MKFRTVHKIVAGAVVFILLGVIGTLWFKSTKEDSNPEVEVVISSPNESANSVAQTDTMHKDVVAAPSREDKLQISAAELQQIEDFFAQLEEGEAQSESDTPQFSTDTEVVQDTGEHFSDDTGAEIEQSAEKVMNEFVEAFRGFDFEAVLPFTTGNARKPIETTLSILSGVLPNELVDDYLNSLENRTSEDGIDEVIESAYKAMDSIRSPENLGKWRQMFSQTQIVSSEHVGDEFEFRLAVPLPDTYGNFGLVVRMRRINGEWRIYEMES